MKQALHIFKKDVRYLRLEICLILTLSAVFAWVDTHSPGVWWMEMLLTIGAMYAIARVIHAEAIPGDTQFWITRPYRWKSLLGAKILFILVFVNLPIFTARLYVLTSGFPLVSVLPGLLWSQLLMILAASLPLAALAAVTTGVVPFIFSALIALAIAAGAPYVMYPRFYSPHGGFLGPAEWVWNSIVIITLIASAIPIMYVQYKRRSTLFSRLFGLSVTTLGAVAYLLVPWPFVLAVQKSVSRQTFDTSSVQVALDPGSKLSLVQRDWPGVLDLPIVVRGVPDGVDVDAEALAVTFQGSDGRIWKSTPYYRPQLHLNQSGPGNSVLNAIVMVDKAFFSEQREKRVTLHASLYVMLFGNARYKTISLDGGFADVGDGLRCYRPPESPLWLETSGRVYCTSPFRWPNRLLYAKYSENDTRSFQQDLSYSPFPSNLSFDYMAGSEVSAPRSAREVTMVIKEPLANIRLDFEARDIRLTDFQCCR